MLPAYTLAMFLQDLDTVLRGGNINGWDDDTISMLVRIDVLKYEADTAREENTELRKEVARLTADRDFARAELRKLLDTLGHSKLALAHPPGCGVWEEAACSCSQTRR